MRILLIANYLPDAQQSMQRFAAMLEAGFTKAGHEVRTVRPSVKAGRLAWNESGTKWFGYVDKLVVFPRVLRKVLDWADIIHICDHSNSVYVKYLKGRPHVVTCHDLLAVRSACGDISHQTTRWSGRRLQSMILAGLARARQIVCDSNATRDDAIRVLANVGERRNEIACIYIGLNYPYSPMGREEAAERLHRMGLAHDQPFLLHVGANQWYKNRLGVLRTFALLRKSATIKSLVLVMVGKPRTLEMQKFIRSQELERSVVELLNVPEEDLRALYSSAELMLFPSLAEGFGWPIIEAQACGCPVVTSNVAPMTEVGGSAAIYVDPADPESVAREVVRVLELGPGSKLDYRQAGLRNAARFSASAMIRQYQELYQQLAAPHASSELQTGKDA